MFNFFGAKAGPSINEAAQTAKENPSIRLFDVRSREEFKEGHIPGSVSLPLDKLDNVQALVLDRNEKIYVYCASGGRSAAAASALKRMGYSDVTNIGGIMNYSGPLAR